MAWCAFEERVGAGPADDSTVLLEERRQIVCLAASDSLVCVTGAGISRHLRDSQAALEFNCCEELGAILVMFAAFDFRELSEDGSPVGDISAATSQHIP
jgi:hypothetical protein